VVFFDGFEDGTTNSHASCSRERVSRFTSPIALTVLASQSQQRFGRLLGLDQIRDRRQIQAVSHLHERGRHTGVSYIGTGTINERTTDLDEIKEEQLQVAQRGESGTEVTEHELQAERVQLIEGGA
jgi:hypothetical protein